MEKHYGYNALNQLISEVDSMAERENKKQFHYDKRENLIEILLNGRLEDQYSYGALDRLEYAKNAAGMVEEDFSHKFYLQDEMGSPLRLVGADGDLQESYSYDEFGRDLYPDRMQTQPFGFTGYQADHVAGTYFAQAREYMPSAGRFVSRDADKFISIGNMQSINLYQYCMSNPVRYIDPSGNDLEDQYPLSRNGINDAVQIKVSGNEIRIDVYVDFEGDERLTTANGTPCKDLAIAGIENWSGNYQDVFGENVTVSVKGHEKNIFSPLLHRYIKINLEEGDGVPRTSHGVGEWSNTSDRTIYMYRTDSRTKLTFSDEEYVRTITHEMGHVFGVGDGYADPNADPKAPPGIYRPDAFELGFIDENDVMRHRLKKLNISNADIGLLILAYWEDAHQSFTEFTGHRQSKYFQQEEKQ